MRRLLALALLLCSGSAHAQVTQAQVSNAIATQLPSGQQISAASLRSVLELMNTATFQPSGSGGVIGVANMPTAADMQHCGGTQFPTSWFAINCIVSTNWNVDAGPNLIGNFTIQTEINGTSAQAGGVMFGLVSNIVYYKDAGVTDRNSYSAIIGGVGVAASPTPSSDFGVFGINCNVGAVGGIVWPLHSQFICFEADNTVATPGLEGRAMIKLVNNDVDTINVQGTTFDAMIYAQNAPVHNPFGFKNFILIDVGAGGNVVATNGCVICSTTGGGSIVDKFIDFSTWEFTTWLIHSSIWSVNGAGQQFMGNGTGLADITMDGGNAGTAFGTCITMENAHVPVFYIGQPGACISSAFDPNVQLMMISNANLSFGTNNVTRMTINNAGGITVPFLPTVAGGGGLNVCIDSVGVLYKKAACP